MLFSSPHLVIFAGAGVCILIQAFNQEWNGWIKKEKGTGPDLGGEVSDDFCLGSPAGASEGVKRCQNLMYPTSLRACNSYIKLHHLHRGSSNRPKCPDPTIWTSGSPKSHSRPQIRGSSREVRTFTMSDSNTPDPPPKDPLRHLEPSTFTSLHRPPAYPH
jgi:hypothetical protein